jgi:hypothetical protein
VHQVPLYDKESRHQMGHQTFVLFYFNDAVGVVPQQGVAAPKGAPDTFLFQFIY